MSEYWVSKKKYFCKYCDIYITDDAPSRQQHENGMRHKGNVERFIRGIYKTGEKQKKDREEEVREMKRVEQAAAVAFSQDVSSGLVKPTSTPVASTSTSSVAKKPPPKPSNPYANYTTAESLGYSDPDAERLAAELETRRTQGVAGDWYTVTPTAPQPNTPDVTQVRATDANTSPIGEAREAGIKRWPDAPPEDDVRSFKLRKKTLQTGLGEIYDPGLIPIKLKKKEESVDASTADTVLTSSNIAKPEPQEAMATSLPRWTTKIQLLNRSKDGSSTSDVTVKKEQENGCCSTSTSKWAKPKWSEALPDHTPSDRASIFGSGRLNEEAPSPAVEEKPDIKVDVEGEILGTADNSLSSAGMFKKRRAPNNVRRDRREM